MQGYPTRKATDINTAYAYVFNAKPTTQPMCNPKQQSTENYGADFPMATAQPGETIYTAWEQNGHLVTTNPTKVYVLYYPDSTKEFSNVSERTTAPVAGSFNFATPANCFTTQDNSVCLGSWVVPKNLVPGKTYHFVWFWYFNKNPAGEWYSTCFDIAVKSSSYVVNTADMPTLLKQGNPPDSYAYGLNAEAKSLIAKVTTLPENKDSPAPGKTPTPVPTPTTTFTAVIKDKLAAATPTTSASEVEANIVDAKKASAVARIPAILGIPLHPTTKIRKCRPRPIKCAPRTH
ncbi:hypothetical protein IW140_006403 [Coemansia sp. RSA 1813]|nr:hypothetical protein IW140_006403 [Coemansia sp. RSA 1813]